MNYYIPLHEILHDHSNDYINLQNSEVHDVMACNLKVNTCYYMHYQPLHAPQHLESCIPERKQANWYIPVCTGTHQYQQVQDFPDRYKQVHHGTRQYQVS